MLCTPAWAGEDALVALIDRSAQREFILRMSERHGFEPLALERLLAKAEYSAAAIRLSAPTPPSMTPSWNAYRARFIEPIRLRHGVAFWRANAAALSRAENQWGVPAEVIASIIGVETIYGRNTGDFRILDVLMTLAFEDGRRPDLYRDELEAFLLWTREAGIDPLEPRGSYAGAIGLPQFMPSSIRRWAVDFDGNGRIDLRSSAVDAIGSVANFLAGHGWERGASASWPARLGSNADLTTLTKDGIELKFLPAQLAALGVESDPSLPPDAPLALVEFQNGGAPSHFRITGKNFWVVTRYNRSRYYALAVLDFAQALKEALDGKTTGLGHDTRASHSAHPGKTGPTNKKGHTAHAARAGSSARAGEFARAGKAARAGEVARSGNLARAGKPLSRETSQSKGSGRHGHKQ